MVPGGTAAEARQALTNIKNVLEAAGSSLDNVRVVGVSLAWEWGCISEMWVGSPPKLAAVCCCGGAGGQVHRAVVGHRGLQGCERGVRRVLQQEAVPSPCCVCCQATPCQRCVVAWVFATACDVTVVVLCMAHSLCVLCVVVLTSPARVEIETIALCPQ